jgi:hypothetical protein
VAGHIPWTSRTWALPVLTVLAHSGRYYQRLGKAHKKLTHWARQIILQLRHWLPKRTLVLVADNSYAILTWLHPSAGSGQASANLSLNQSPSSPVC